MGWPTMWVVVWVSEEKFCNNACVERFLKAKGDSVKKAAKQLRNCLSWRDSIGTDTLIADEFSAELAEGLAYVAGHDDELRPVMIFRMKQDYHKCHSQKLFTRLLVFTIEVAVQTMAKNVDQFVLLFDASFFRSASAFMNMLLTTLKIIADYYPARLHRVFVIDPPSLFTYLWKGVKPFVELSPLTSVVSSLDYEDSLEYNNNDFALYPRAVSMRFDSSASSAKVGGGECSSSRFSFTVSTHHVDSLKPWYLSTSSAATSKVGPTNPSSSAAISPHNARSHSFASPRGASRSIDPAIRKNFFPSTPMPQRTQKLDPSMIRQYPRTPKASFLQSPALFFKRDHHHYHHQQSRVDKSRESFVPFVNFYRRPYDEMIYRSKMRPPLGGLVSIVSPQVRRRHVSISQRF
ncbi:Sec14p-like phosphatidylinositol transfer family protein [Striga hermonthica]|uniref:Sec14p-like phosphatidylinositol transfer family protein n=1 Tax=Striga hermonthica TaxID=68872 RepID=A0A9N7RJ59_STRHE|nr:Sec14p-like phosphatidylinositol transfer family protein [Striga hermonthica]